MPPSDPRYLGMTEAEILHDLLVLHYQDQTVAAEMGVLDLEKAGGAQQLQELADQASMPESVADVYEKIRAAKRQQREQFSEIHAIRLRES